MPGDVTDVSGRQTVTAPKRAEPFMLNDNVKLWDGCEFVSALELGNKTRRATSLNLVINGAEEGALKLGW